VGAEEHRVRELSLVVDAGEVEDADADAVRREPDADPAARKLVGAEELVEPGREPPLPFATRAAAIWVAPSFTPTSSPPVDDLPPKRDFFFGFAADCLLRLGFSVLRESRISFLRFMRHLPGV
jgi:hypothetical protein